MSYYVIEVRLQLGLSPGARVQELDQAEHELMKRIMPLDVHAVGRDMLMAPPDAPAEDYADDAGIKVEVESTGVESVLTTVADWLAGESDVSVSISIAGDSVVLAGPSDEERRTLERFIDRHGLGQP